MLILIMLVTMTKMIMMGVIVEEKITKSENAYSKTGYLSLKIFDKSTRRGRLAVAETGTIAATSKPRRVATTDSTTTTTTTTACIW